MEAYLRYVLSETYVELAIASGTPRGPASRSGAARHVIFAAYAARVTRDAEEERT
jgi:hypothetical protein